MELTDERLFLCFDSTMNVQTVISHINSEKLSLNYDEMGLYTNVKLLDEGLKEFIACIHNRDIKYIRQSNSLREYFLRYSCILKSQFCNKFCETIEVEVRNQVMELYPDCPLGIIDRIAKNLTYLQDMNFLNPISLIVMLMRHTNNDFETIINTAGLDKLCVPVNQYSFHSLDFIHFFDPKELPTNDNYIKLCCALCSEPISNGTFIMYPILFDTCYEFERDHLFVEREQLIKIYDVTKYIFPWYPSNTLEIVEYIFDDFKMISFAEIYNRIIEYRKFVSGHFEDLDYNTIEYDKYNQKMSAYENAKWQIKKYKHIPEYFELLSIREAGNVGFFDPSLSEQRNKVIHSETNEQHNDISRYLIYCYNHEHTPSNIKIDFNNTNRSSAPIQLFESVSELLEVKFRDVFLEKGFQESFIDDLKKQYILFSVNYYRNNLATLFSIIGLVGENIFKDQHIMNLHIGSLIRNSCYRALQVPIESDIFDIYDIYEFITNIRIKKEKYRSKTTSINNKYKQLVLCLLFSSLGFGGPNFKCLHVIFVMEYGYVPYGFFTEHYMREIAHSSRDVSYDRNDYKNMIITMLQLNDSQTRFINFDVKYNIYDPISLLINFFFHNPEFQTDWSAVYENL